MNIAGILRNIGRFLGFHSPPRRHDEERQVHLVNLSRVKILVRLPDRKFKILHPGASMDFSEYGDARIETESPGFVCFELRSCRPEECPPPVFSGGPGDPVGANLLCND